MRSANARSCSPGSTAHAILGVVDWGAVCKTGSAASGLRVYAPGGTSAEPIDAFPLEVCAKAGTLSIDPVSSGVGVPVYTAVPATTGALAAARGASGSA